MRIHKAGVVVSLISILLSVGCAGAPVNIPNVKGSDYKILGEGSGSAVGIMLFNVIPIGQNSRFERAYNQAVARLGGDALVDPVFSERWFWAYALNGYITTVKGTVVKHK